MRSPGSPRRPTVETIFLSSSCLEVRDLELGMVDFPTLLGSEPAFFCWRVDDPTIAFWHSADKGHRERLPLEASALHVA